LVIENADEALVAQIQALIEQSGKAKLLRSGHPRTTLERLFLESTAEPNHGGKGDA
jgi:ABC-2 type transport system ATP-binding protein